MLNLKDIKDITLEEAERMARNGLYLIIRDKQIKGFTTK